jgi:hypothetical protein
VYLADSGSKTLQPFSSGDALTEQGYNFGQVQNADPNAFGAYSLGGAINSKADALNGVKNDLNSFQDSLYNADGASNKRQASQLDDSINQALSQQADAEKQFNDLRTQFNSQDNFSLSDALAQLEKDQGVAGINSDLVTTREAERNLEGDLRGVSGNAGVLPESVFQANLAQKQQPLLLKEQTLTDRLAAANDYITKALNAKGTDAQNASTHLQNAATLLQDTMGSIQNRLSNLNTLRSNVQSNIDKGQSTAQATINTLIQTGALNKLSGNDLNTLELEAGMPAGTLSSVAKSIQPQAQVLGTEVDNAGNVSIITQNPDGSFSAHVVPGAKGPSKVGTGDSTSAISFSATDKQALVAAGLTSSEIGSIQNDLNKFGIDAVTKGLPGSQAQALNKVLGGATNNQFIDSNFLTNEYGAGLADAAKKAGYTTKGGGLFGSGLLASTQPDTSSFLTHLMSLVSQYRQAGYSDNEILKLLPS